MKDDRLYLTHISECISKVESFVASGKREFLAEPMRHDAVIRNLQTLAESTRRLSDPIKASHPEVDWKSIAGFRNVVVHDYLGLDLNQIWDIVERDIPILKNAIEVLMQE